MITTKLWVLIIIVSTSSNGVTMTTQEFQTKANCMFAGKTFINSFTESQSKLDNYFSKNSYVCVEK